MEYTFNFRQSETGYTTAYLGSETLYDDSSPEYIALDCGNDLIDKFKEYYEQGFQRMITATTNDYGDKAYRRRQSRASLG